MNESFKIGTCVTICICLGLIVGELFRIIDLLKILAGE